MATYVLIHGAGDSAFYWHLVAPELEAGGNEVVAVDLPCEDESAGLSEYADAVVEAIGDRTGLIVVAHSLGGFTAPLVCDRLPVELMVLVAAMVPLPGEKGDDWTANTGYPGSAVPGDEGDDDVAVFYHDVPPALAAEALARGRAQAEAPGREPLPLDSWPEVPTRFLLCREDRMFPAAWMRGVVRERLGIAPDELDGGHCPALSRPARAGRAAGGLPGRAGDPVKRYGPPQGPPT
jgi:pimeloyl-ACP methyl ester carboxylesterase